MEVFCILTRFMYAVIGGGSNEQHSRHGGGQQTDKMDYLPGSRQLFEPLGKDNCKLKSKKSLRTGQCHAAFQQDFFNTIRKVRLVAVFLFLLARVPFALSALHPASGLLVTSHTISRWQMRLPPSYYWGVGN